MNLTFHASIDYVLQWQEWSFERLARELDLPEGRVKNAAPVMFAFVSKWQSMDPKALAKCIGLEIPVFDVTDFKRWATKADLVSSSEFRALQKSFHIALGVAGQRIIRTLKGLRFHGNEIAAEVNVQPAQINRWASRETAPTYPHFLNLERFLEDQIKRLHAESFVSFVESTQFGCSKAARRGPHHERNAYAARERCVIKARDESQTSAGAGTSHKQRVAFRLEVRTEELDDHDDAEAHVFRNLSLNPSGILILIRSKLSPERQWEVFVRELSAHVKGILLPDGNDPA